MRALSRILVLIAVPAAASMAQQEDQTAQGTDAQAPEVRPATDKGPAVVRPAASSAPQARPASSKAGGAPTSQPPASPSKAAAPSAQPSTAPDKKDAGSAPGAPTLEETRLTLSKWIETQQIISKERNDWQQGKEILAGRIDLVGKEVGQLKDRIAQAEAAVAESNRKRDSLTEQNTQLKQVGTQLANAVADLEARVRTLAKVAPEGVAAKLAPLLQRIPTDAAGARVSTAERFQNVLGILNELNKANSEISIAYEVRKLPDGSSSEVQVIYVGLAQAYYLSPRGDAGIGKPTPDGWTWRSAPEQANAIYAALEIIKGKEQPAFVALPVSIQ